MTPEKPPLLVPTLRFPEFTELGPWVATPLDDLCDRVSETVGGTQLTPVSISAGKGFVPQAEKFGRDISGSQYSQYIYLRRGDFAYNRGNSKKFPQGCVYQLTEFAEAAASNAFHCFRLHHDVAPAFISAFFEGNGHGRQLVPYITSGARSNGLLNIGADTFFGVSIPIPPTASEQKKVADCLGSLDDLIAREGRKLGALREHKQGLMQQLFPQDSETVPRLRFPEFADAPVWKQVAIGSLLSERPTYGVNAPAVPFSESLPAYIRITDISDDGQFEPDPPASVDVNPTDDQYVSEGDILLARTGASVGKSYLHREEDGRLVYAGFLIRVRPRPGRLVSQFLAAYLSTPRYWDWVRQTSARSGQPGINGSEYASLPFPLPPDGEGLSEQRRIAECLSVLDDQIGAQARKLVTLKQHKHGLLQQLLPSLGGQ